MSAKRFYWLRLKRDFFKRHDIKIIESLENGDKYLLFLLKLMAESVDHEGALRFSDEIPYNESMLSTITGTDIDIVRSALKVFAEFRLIEILDDQTLYMNCVQNLIGSQGESTQRTREWRERQKLLEDASHVTNGDANVASPLSLTLDSSSSSKKEASFEKLEAQYGKDVIDDYRERVADYDAQRPPAKRYKNIPAAIRNWLKRDGIKPKPTPVKRVVVAPAQPVCPVCDSSDVKQLMDELVCHGCGNAFTWNGEGWEVDE